MVFCGNTYNSLVGLVLQWGILKLNELNSSEKTILLLISLIKKFKSFIFLLTVKLLMLNTFNSGWHGEFASRQILHLIIIIIIIYLFANQVDCLLENIMLA